VSAGLGQEPVQALAYLPGSEDGLFAATDRGVYYRDERTSTWMTYDLGLPRVLVTSLAYQPGEGNLVAATWGRSQWETPLCGGTPREAVRSDPLGNDTVLALRPLAQDELVETGAAAASGVPDIFVAVVDANLDPTPLRRDAYRQRGPAAGNAIVTTGDGTSHVVVGTGSNGVHGGTDIVFLRVSAIDLASAGPIDLGTGGNDAGNDIVERSDTGFVVAGRAGTLALILRLSDSGIIQGNSYPFAAGTSEATAIAAVDDGFMVTGWCRLGGSTDDDIFLQHLDVLGAPTGSPIVIDSPGTSERPKSMVAAFDGTLVIAGLVGDPDLTGPRDAYVVKVKPSGTVLWQHTSDAPFDDLAYRVAEDDNGFWVIGTATSDLQETDVHAAHLTIDGCVEWERSYGGSRNEEGRALALLKRSSRKVPTTAIVGGSKTSAAGDTDEMLRKVTGCFIPFDPIAPGGIEALQ
jgi:hypothetical protein